MTTALVAFIFAAICVVCGTVLAAMGHAVPVEVWTLAGVGVGGGAGVSLPSSGTTKPPTTP